MRNRADMALGELNKLFKWHDVDRNIITRPISLFSSISNRKRRIAFIRRGRTRRDARWPIYRQKCRFNSHRYSLSSITSADKRARYVRDLSFREFLFRCNKRRSLKVINRHALSCTRSRTRIYRRKWPPHFPSPWLDFYHLGHARRREKTRLLFDTQRYYRALHSYSLTKIISLQNLTIFTWISVEFNFIDKYIDIHIYI